NSVHSILEGIGSGFRDTSVRRSTFPVVRSAPLQPQRGEMRWARTIRLACRWHGPYSATFADGAASDRPASDTRAGASSEDSFIILLDVLVSATLYPSYSQEPVTIR